MSPRSISIAGTSSNSGKTTLLCELLRQLSVNEEWEAIKMTRGHYRSCGKDPHACCVSNLLSDQPTIRSGREETYAFGKDTGRYWDAGAVNVHWVIATDSQVEAGINEAIGRVKAPNVLIEGTSLLRFIQPDLAILVANAEVTKTKASVRRALLDKKINAIYLPHESLFKTRGEVAVTLSQISPEIDFDWLNRLPVVLADESHQLLDLLDLQNN